MADFCKQCSLEIFGKDYKDMAGLSTEEHTKKGKFAIVLCEDCGATQVDHDGVCISKDCLKKHGVLSIKGGLKMLVLNIHIMGEVKEDIVELEQRLARMIHNYCVEKKHSYTIQGRMDVISPPTEPK
jgi:hypothetical protein